MLKPCSWKTVWIATAVSCLAFSAGACGAGPAEELDLTKTYSSLPELKEASTDTVQLTTGKSHLEGDHDLQFVVTPAFVVSTDARGEVTRGDTIRIRQMEGEFTNIAPVLEADQSYVAYIKPWAPFDMADGTDTGQFQIVGSQAVWQVDGDVGHLTTGDSSLPSHVSVASVAGDLDLDLVD